LITVRNLLTHTSGIKSYTELAKVMREMPEHTFKDAELVALFQDEPLAFEPGSKFAYCNSGYYLLGMIVKEASGKDYCSFLQDEFFTPLKLDHTRCDSNDRVVKNRAQGYRLVAGKLANDQMMSTQTPGAAGMLISSARDLATWANLLASGKVVSSESYRQMTTPFELADGSSTGYGFGLGIKEGEGRKEIEHGGGIFGFNSDLASFPDEGLILAVISNSESIPSQRILASITRAAFGVAEAAAADMPVSEAEAARFVGTYALAPTFEMQVRSANGKVTVQATNQPELPILYQGKGEFRASFDPNVKLVFDMSGTGPCPSFVLHQNGEHKAVRKP
jgi:CubicO group peptidase (beta-lactamase class C family)